MDITINPQGKTISEMFGTTDTEMDKAINRMELFALKSEDAIAYSAPALLIETAMRAQFTDAEMINFVFRLGYAIGERDGGPPLQIAKEMLGIPNSGPLQNDQYGLN